MGHSIAAAAVSGHRVYPEHDRRMAKADLRFPENRDFKAEIGGCIDRARLSLGWTLDQFAGEMGKDPRQIRRWIDGSENAQFSALFSIDALRGPLVVQLATLSGDIVVETTIRLRRTA